VTCGGIVTGSPIPQKSQGLIPGASAHQREKGVKVCLSLLMPAQDYPRAGLKIHAAKQHALGLLSGKGHQSLRACVGPPMAQRRKEAQESFICKEHTGIRCKSP
jgi:hypothetical protein